MITPLFKIEQNDTFIIVKALLKYIKFSDFDYYVQDNNFRFSLKPYHLNIYLSNNLNPISNANTFSYDIQSYMLIAQIEKEEHGVQFTNLELLSTLFENSHGKNTITTIKIEEVSQGQNDTNHQQHHHQSILNTMTTEEQLNDYLFEAYSAPDLESLSLLPSTEENKQYCYGFNNLFNDVFDKRYEDMLEITDLNPKKIQRKFRYLAMLEKDSLDFIPERYICDKYLSEPDNEEGEHFRSIMKLNISEYIKRLTEGNPSGMLYNEKDIQVLQDINKTKLSFIDTNNHFEFYLQLLDVLFAFLYDVYMTEYEHSSESGWTINKLSSVFSNMIDFNKNFYSQSKEISFDILNDLIKNVLIASYRRVLVYPLYRSIDLCDKIRQDLKILLNEGKIILVKCLIEIRNIFEKNEPRFLLNTMFIDPYLKWIQFYSDDKICKIVANVIEKVTIEKNDLKLNLEQYEKDFEMQIDAAADDDEDNK